VEIYRQVSFQTELLSLFAARNESFADEKLKGMTAREVKALYDKYISEDILNDKLDYRYYKFRKDKEEYGYVFSISVKGLWSKIELLVAMEPDFSRYIGMKIIEQGETPGLGARITEDWFQNQFTGKKFAVASGFAELKLIDENAEPQNNKIRQITGATASSRAVAEGLQNELQRVYKMYMEDNGQVK
jgi:Na(+)-translocating NADH:ubiquinone oxidoreductase C subunit